MRKAALVYLQITIGSFLFALGVEAILIPNNVIDSGVTGVSIMLNHLFGVATWIPFLFINAAILGFAASSIGKKFVARTVYANIVSAVSLQALHHFKPVTHSELLTIVFGGLCIGAGVAFAVRNSAAIDGAEMLAIWINKHFHKPISGSLLFINIFVFAASAFVFSLEKALFSVATFYVATKAIDFILDGFNQAKSIMIISASPYAVGESLMKELDLSVTYLHGEGGFSKEERKIIYCISDRLLYPKIREITLASDPDAILEASYVAETTGVSKSSLRNVFKK